MRPGGAESVPGAFLQPPGNSKDAFGVVGLSLPGHDVWCDENGDCDAFNVRVCLAAPMYDAGGYDYQVLTNVEYAIRSESGWLANDFANGGCQFLGSYTDEDH